jgi:hypothetical protein
VEVHRSLITSTSRHSTRGFGWRRGNHEPEQVQPA